MATPTTYMLTCRRRIRDKQWTYYRRLNGELATSGGSGDCAQLSPHRTGLSRGAGVAGILVEHLLAVDEDPFDPALYPQGVA